MCTHITGLGISLRIVTFLGSINFQKDQVLDLHTKTCLLKEEIKILEGKNACLDSDKQFTKSKVHKLSNYSPKARSRPSTVAAYFR